jgi:predicted DNA-binding transcriptional regulator AlpA
MYAGDDESGFNGHLPKEPRMTTTTKNYYTVPEAAEFLSVNPSTIWRWIKSGKLPA